MDERYRTDFVGRLWFGVFVVVVMGQWVVERAMGLVRRGVS